MPNHGQETWIREKYCSIFKTVSKAQHETANDTEYYNLYVLSIYFMNALVLLFTFQYLKILHRNLLCNGFMNDNADAVADEYRVLQMTSYNEANTLW